MMGRPFLDLGSQRDAELIEHILNITHNMWYYGPMIYMATPKFNAKFWPVVI